MSASLVCLAYLGGGSHRRYPAQALDIPAAVVSGRPGYPNTRDLRRLLL